MLGDIGNAEINTKIFLPSVDFQSLGEIKEMHI